MDRIERERAFHDQRFRDPEQDVRDELGKYYSIYGLNRACFDELLQKYLPGADVLEYGCARGDKALRWARAGARVKGIDISGEAIRIANERAQREGLPAQFHAMNAEQMDFSDRSFDVVFGEGILHHLELARALGEIARVLRPSGRAIFVEPLGHNPIINLYRKLTPKMRTADEHPLLRKDLDLMRRCFQKVDAKFFHLSTLASVPLRKTPLFNPLLHVLQAVDTTLFKLLPPIRAWAWVAVIEMVEPL
jgi:ubiquinone/menaquinone biosynthesis C-methylase UbiE